MRVRKLKVRPTAEDEIPSPEELSVAARVKTEIEAMFGHARLATDPEIGAYIRTPFRDYIYDALKNGYWERGGHFPLDTPLESDEEAAISRSIEEFTREFPDAKNQQLVWRLEPEFRRLKASAAMEKWGIPAYPERVVLYLRFTVTPLGVHGGKRN
jgi:hypothetical protein